MALRRLLGCLPVAALAVCALTGCKDGDGDPKEDAGGKPAATGAAGDALAKRCEQLGKACGAQDKHQQKITEECKEAAKAQTAKGCTDKTVVAYDCYEKEICANINKVWAMDDLRVLGERHTKCVDERKAIDACVAGAK